MSEPLIISAHAGGLGDNLLYSTLPEVFARKGRRIFIGNEPPTRNPETLELVWRHNPFVEGILPIQGEFGAKVFRGNELIAEAKKWKSPIQAVEALHGVKIPHNLYPRIYYKAKWRPEFRTRVLVDPTSISQDCPSAIFDEYVQWVCRWHGYVDSDLLLIRSRYHGQNGRASCAGIEEYAVSTLFEYADLIYSARAIICAESGAQVFASAIKGHHDYPIVHGIHTTMSYNDRIFIFPNVNVVVTGRTSGDFHAYP